MALWQRGALAVPHSRMGPDPRPGMLHGSPPRLAGSRETSSGNVGIREGSAGVSATGYVNVSIRNPLFHVYSLAVKLPSRLGSSK